MEIWTVVGVSIRVGTWTCLRSLSKLLAVGNSIVTIRATGNGSQRE
jgi:hypothetical protein